MGPILGGMPIASFDPAKFSLAFAGNSIADPNYLNSDLVPQLQALSPISNRLTIANRSHAGYGFAQLESAASEIDNSFVPGKVNFLIVWELTNTIYNDGHTGLETATLLGQYIANRKAVHPWRVVVMTGLPRGDILGNKWNVYSGELEMEACNAYIRAHYRDLGAIALVEARRPGGPFDFTDASNASNFPSNLWVDRTHPTSAGRTYLAQYMADVLKRLPAR